MSHLKIKSSMTTMTQEVYEYNIFGFKMKILKAAVVLAMHFTGLRLIRELPKEGLLLVVQPHIA